MSRWWTALEQTQRSKLFKLIASGVVIALAVVGMIVYGVAAAKAREQAISQMREFMGFDPDDPNAMMPEPPAQAGQAVAPDADSGSAAQGMRPDDAMIATGKVFKGIVSAQHSAASVITGIAIGSVLCLVIIWIDLGLTYLVLAGVAGALLALCSWLGMVRTAGPFIVGLFALTGAFSAIMRLMLALLSFSHPVVSIARTVLQEAVRMKVSIIFIVVMIFGLATLPLLLSDDQPLRYRVQSFLQYGTGGAFMIIAALVVLFSVMTVSAEQRDKQIWQTMTKPVAPWQYVLGKWLGVGVLAAVLLGVSASGIFVFTEFLRRQPAIGETTAFKPSDPRLITEDRRLLETQVLTSRTTIAPDAPNLDYNELEKAVEEKVQQELATMSIVGDTPSQLARNTDKARERIRGDLMKGVGGLFRTVEPGDNRVYTFSGLNRAKELGRPLLFKYKIQSGGNMPDQLYRITIALPGVQAARVFEVPLDQTLVLELMPDIITPEGKAVIQIFNADLERRIMNARPISFPRDGLALSYATGSYQANYIRLMLVLWIKLLFLAMVGVCAATFLSFPVAALVSFAVFWAAEGASFLTKALENYAVTDLQGNTLWFNTIVANIAEIIAGIFSTYAELRPTARLVEGEHLSWFTLAGGSLVVLLWCAALFVAGTLIFRRRELAIYSGS